MGGGEMQQLASLQLRGGAWPEAGQPGCDSSWGVLGGLRAFAFQGHLPGPPAASARRSALRTPARDTPRGPGPAHESYPEPSRSCPQPGTPPAPRSPRPGQDASPSPRPVNLALRPKVKVELRRGSEGARGQGNRQARVFPDRGAKGERAQGAS